MIFTDKNKKEFVSSRGIFQRKEVFRSKRIEDLRNLLLSQVPIICSERAELITESYQETEGEPVVIRRAKALEKILRNMSIYILDGELIVGNQGSKPRSAPIFPEFGINWIIEELDGNPMRVEERPGDRYNIKPEDEAKIRKVARYWQGQTHEDRVRVRLPQDALDAWKLGVLNSYWLMIGGDGHLVVNLKKVINEGIISIKKQAEKRLQELDLADPEELKQEPFLKSVIISTQAIIDFAHRYAKLARKMSMKEKDNTRKEELLTIAEVCERVPEYPARNFHEALQAQWFVNLVLQLENNGHSISFGRFDQNLYKFYKQDIETEVIDRDDILELLECLWLKLFQLHKITCWDNTKFFSGYQLFQNVTIGGQTKNGADATNELSYLVLETQEAIRLTTPSISVRYHDRISDEFLHAATDIIKLGGGQPALYSDEVYIPALINRGICWDDAVEYSIVGCAEAIVEGKQSGRPNGASFVNLGKILELALNNGRDPETGLYLCPGDGDLSTFTSYEEVVKAFKKQAAFYLREQVIMDNCIDYVTEEGIADPFVSCLVDDCVARGKTMKEGGAVYDYCGPLYVGVANVGNSLAAIKKLVFDEKKITGEQLKHTLETNFADNKTNPTGSEIRKMLLDAPKYGNDNDYVDSIMVDYFRFICDETAKYRTTRYGRGPIGCTWQPSTSSVSANVPFGIVVGATPDGRLSGEALADTTSPAHSTDINGPTLSLKSVGKLPTVLVSGGQLLNMKFSPSSLTGSGRECFISLLRTFLGDLKGMHVQFNIVSIETLKEAQKHPEKYRDLMVRVAGYSALFTALDKVLQDDIIARTEHKLA